MRNAASIDDQPKENGMKVAFPAQEDLGMDSPVFSHFGSARYFIVVDTEDPHPETIENSDRHHRHGQCNPTAALGDTPVDVVVVGGIGGGALRKLQSSGIKVYRAVEGSVRENLDLIVDRKLMQFAFDQTCSGHKEGHECVH
jgi:predicted Fe-Mo cluster-binding NifX family protein